MSRLSIRQKIIFPFILIMAITSFIFMAISINFISKNIEKSLVGELDKQSLIVKKSLEDRFKKSIFYAQLISDMKKNLDRIPDKSTVQSVKGIFLDLINQDFTTVYLSLNDIETWKKQMYADLINDGYQGKTKVSISVSEDKDQHLILTAAAVGSVKNNGLYYPIISEYSFNNRFLIEDIKGKYKSDIALIFHGVYKDRLQTEILASTQLFFQNRAFKQRINAILTAPDKGDLKRFIDSIEIDGKSYKILIERLDLNPQVYTAVVIRSDGLIAAKQNVIQMTILAFVGLTLVMIFVYLLIIRRITASLDVLSEGVNQVAKGDLYHQVPIRSHDEIGRLSIFFNQMVRNLRESTQNVVDEKNRSEAIISNIPEGIIVTDSKNRLILANQMAEEMFHFSLQDTYGKFILECINHEDLLSAIQIQMEHTDTRYSRELKMSKDNKEHYYILNSSVAHNKTGEQIGVITVLRDITHDKELIELREGFLRTVSHELRTPLTSIIGFIDIILQGAVGSTTKEQREYLSISLNQALSLKRLINDLLDLSRIEAGKVRLMFSEIQLRSFLNDLALFLMPIIKERHNTLVIEETTTADIVLTADIERVRRILINLISNASKFTENGKITVRYSIQGTDLLFAIQDTGIGLKQEEQVIIFDKFRQADFSSTRQFEGIGLGLPIAKELVELHDGRIWVESEFGHGATFYFTLPIKPKHLLIPTASEDISPADSDA